MSVVDDIQTTGDSETRETVRNKLKKKIQRHRERQNLGRDAHLRQLLKVAEDTLTGERELDPTKVLEELHWVLRVDSRLPGVLSPRSSLDETVKLRFKRLAKAREQGVDPDPMPEFEVYAELCEGIGVISNASDLTRYAPVTMEPLDLPGATSSTSDPSPVGRIRIPHDSPSSMSDKQVEIPHEDAEHILVLANPRKGKDSTICRLCGNLKDEHGYKWISLFDDGRNETPMTAIPSDEQDIRRILDRDFGTSPKGYKTRVYVPATGLDGEELPANFHPFTIGVDSLTPEMIATLSGVTPDASIERRIRMALNDAGGSVRRLIGTLQRYAEELTAEVEVTEYVDEDDADGETYSVAYEMDAETVLEECAESLAMLASEGLLASAGADTNLDMRAEMQAQDRIAVLNCNTLPDGQEHIKYLLVNLWLRLVYRMRDDHPQLPRAVCEMREIKNLAPSKLNDTKYKNVVKSLRQTLFFISSQGGSRRVLMVGSTQKLNDLYKPVRGNMPIKILLQIGQEKINTLRSAGFRFSQDQRDQLEDFDPGWGMLISHGDRHWPIQWCPARCGLGLGDEYWYKRYAHNMGYRFYDGEEIQADRWLDVDGEWVEDRDPDREEWYLLPDDIKDRDDGLQDALTRRRDYPVPQDLRPEPVHGTGNDLDVLPSEEARKQKRSAVKQEYRIPDALEPWLDATEQQRDRWTRILNAIRNEDMTNIRDICSWSGVPQGTASRYMSEDDMLDPCQRKMDGVYELTDAGARALEISWPEVVEAWEEEQQGR